MSPVAQPDLTLSVFERYIYINFKVSSVNISSHSLKGIDLGHKHILQLLNTNRNLYIGNVAAPLRVTLGDHKRSNPMETQN